jgi:hypothetical protein
MCTKIYFIICCDKIILFFIMKINSKSKLLTIERHIFNLGKFNNIHVHPTNGKSFYDP